VRSPVSSGLIRRRVVVHGRVQAVGFRIACARQAAGAGVSGRIRNLPDGSVEVFLEGDAAAVGRLVEWCHRGPPLARVTYVEVEEESPLGERGFAIE
jgi:acylphosphatase